MSLWVLFKLALVLAIVNRSNCHENHLQNYLVCRPLDTLFEQQPLSTTNQTTIRGPPGRPGKLGPQGLKGAPGPAGPVGPEAPMNWSQIDNRIQEILNVSENSEKGNCTGIAYKHHCYWLPFVVRTRSLKGGKSAASNICGSYGATLVDIETSEMYDVLYKYIQKAWMIYVDYPAYDFVDVWLASTYKNGNARGSTGGNIHTRWLSGSPSSRYSEMVWRVGTRPTRVAPSVGMRTTDDSYTIAVPFCRL